VHEALEAALGESSETLEGLGEPALVLTDVTVWERSNCSGSLSCALGDGDLACETQGKNGSASALRAKLDVLRQGGVFEPEDWTLFPAAVVCFAGVESSFGQAARLHHAAPALVSCVVSSFATAMSSVVGEALMPLGTNSAAFTRHGRRNCKGVKVPEDASGDSEGSSSESSE
jgi:hypothetical protein